MCPSPAYCDDSYGVNYRTCSDEYVNGDDIEIELFTDFVSATLGTYQPGADITLRKGIYKCTCAIPEELKAYEKLSSGPIVPIDPSPLHMFEVWANEACTQRPVVGNEYTELYLQVNAELHEQCPTPEYANDLTALTYFTCPSDYEQGDPVDISFGPDWHKTVQESWYSGDPLGIPIGVYAVRSGEPAFFTADLKISFGPTLAR